MGYYHQDERDKAVGIGTMILTVAIGVIMFLIFCIAVIGAQADDFAEFTKQEEAKQEEDNAVVSVGVVTVDDIDYEWQYDAKQDMQLPELPTGCEATAAGTLIRKVTGKYVTKTEVADAMPRSSWDFVNCFLGDPYSERGYTCWAPCVEATIEKLLPEGYVVEDTTGTDFADIVIPSYVYVTEGLEDPVWYSEDSELGKGYKIAHNCHAMVVLGFDIREDKVKVVDPLVEGVTYYSYEQMERIYNEMGKQSVTIMEVPIKGVDY